ncbi:K+/H+ antiporter subunit F [Thalassobaculum fulvum]|uniref:K+/H+ antiporter subunit F n=1 Tax=Thalassobaculum fulvum TaxID=1633335 RepID=A0A919CQG7_9PROT|nr:K+/H+ antiporter subunit F [Thalassobaculum fulvum]GHD55125.1 K+/H+ antiporter subunit F [Thalassobaculum fulvum]
MIGYALAFALAAAAAATMLTLWRLVLGPAAVDRILALDTLAINAIAMIVLAGILWSTPLYFEAAMLFAMVGFLTTVAFCKYLMRGNVME